MNVCAYRSTVGNKIIKNVSMRKSSRRRANGLNQNTANVKIPIVEWFLLLKSVYLCGELLSNNSYTKILKIWLNFTEISNDMCATTFWNIKVMIKKYCHTTLKINRTQTISKSDLKLLFLKTTFLNVRK